MRIRATVALALLASTAMAVGASAHDHRVPRTRLHVGEHGVRLVPWSYEWVRRSGGYCTAQAADGAPTFRPIVDVHEPKSFPRVVFRKPDRPRRVVVRVSDHLEDGYLANAQRIRARLQARHRNGHRFWVASTGVTVTHRLFFDVYARWRDTEGCGGREDASWSFRLRRG
jgi:hypothetical protein